MSDTNEVDPVTDRRSIALHETGHALFAISQGGNVEWITCHGTVIDLEGKRRRFTDNDGHLLSGICFYVLADELRDRLEIRLAGILAGVQAEFTVTGETGHGGELLDALDLAREQLPTEEEAHTLCRWVSEWLAGLFTRNTTVLDALATALMESDDGMNGEAVAEVVTRVGGVTLCPMPDWESVREGAMTAHAGEPFISIIE